VSTNAARTNGPAGFADPVIIQDFENVDALEVLNGLQLKPVSDTFNRSGSTGARRQGLSATDVEQRPNQPPNARLSG